MTLASRQASGITLRPLLFVVVAVALVGLVVFQLSRRGDGGAPQSAGPDADPTLMDPTPYRSVIQEIEAILYKEGEAELADADRVSRLALQLGTQLVRAPNRLQGQRAAQAVTAFSNRVGQQTDVGYARPDLSAARRDWEGVRDKVFVRQSWFRRR